nr:sugar ABC transporter permease [uncultured Faecalimonas sp.]
MQKKQRRHWVKKWNSTFQNKRERIVPWILLAPSLAGVSIFVLIPFADVVRRSFLNAVGREFVGLKNYKSVLQNTAFELAAGNTVRFLAVCLPLLLSISLFLALLLLRAGEKSGLFKSGFLLPMAVPAGSVVLFWQMFFDKGGILNELLEQAGIRGPDYMNTPKAFGVLVAVYLWKNLGYDMILWISGLLGIPDSLYEAAKMDGANGVMCFVHITCPLLLPTAFLTGILSLVNAFKVFREAYMIAGNYPHDSIYMLQNLFNNWFLKLDMQKMTAAAVMLALVLGLILTGSQKIEEKWGRGM